MATFQRVIHVETGRMLVPRARWCDTFTTKLRGFTFKRELSLNEGLVLVETKESRVSTAIHMLFVFFALGVIWVNARGEVVDTVVAKPWRLSYTPRVAARYVIEAHPDVLEQVQPGDHVRFEEAEGD